MSGDMPPKAKSKLEAHKVEEKFNNVWLLTHDDRCKAEDFLNDLENREFAKLLPVMKRVDANPAYRHEERFKYLDGDVYEFKSHKHRLFCFKAERGFVCTDGMKKQKRRRTRISDTKISIAASLAERFAREGEYIDDEE